MKNLTKEIISAWHKADRDDKQAMALTVAMFAFIYFAFWMVAAIQGYVS